MSIQTQLESGAYLLVEIIEQSPLPAGLRFCAVSKVFLEDIAVHWRTPALQGMVAWTLLAKAELSGKDLTEFIPDGTIIPRNISELPDAETLLRHSLRTTEFLKSQWPFEAAYVATCIYDVETAVMALMPSPLPGGMNPEIQLSLLPPGTGGFIARIPSPLSYFPKSNPSKSPTLNPHESLVSYFEQLAQSEELNPDSASYDDFEDDEDEDDDS